MNTGLKSNFKSIGPFIILLSLAINNLNCHSNKYKNEKSEKKDNTHSHIIKGLEELFHLSKDYIRSRNIDTDLEKYINSLSRDKLIQHAFALEVYHRESIGEKHLIGGLHDYVFTVPEEHIKNYIFKKLEEHPEIQNKEMLDDIVLRQGEKEYTKHDREFVIKNSVNELERKDLERLAIELEKYHRKDRDKFIFGGLHDYIGSISDEDLRVYISKEVNEHFEVNNVDKLKEMLE